MADKSDLLADPISSFSPSKQIKRNDGSKTPQNTLGSVMGWM